MNILDTIVARKKEEVAIARKQLSLAELKDSPYFYLRVPSFKENILTLGSTGIIAEFKRKSPSRGDIHAGARVDLIVPGYEKAGVAGVSILTDRDFFGGNMADLSLGREVCDLPIIRKEFIIDPYQVYEAKSIGASAILLIGAILDENRTLELAQLANELGMEVLFEIHDEDEMNQLNRYVQLVGINNRNLKTFEVDLKKSAQMASLLPSGMVPVAESGIGSPDDYLSLKKAGFKGFLMGEYFMKNEDPAAACLDFCNNIRSKI
ncbi:indole-3-glycerol phosphate synthase TrpC [Geofilum sp. OHC36d9]|uniref:indole-3-glycerol phosphate synthase TrpC n=1 Tax=Geofilum sp. OHC36d9 TaxID=3458413 RepID=UPI0040344040